MDIAKELSASLQRGFIDRDFQTRNRFEPKLLINNTASNHYVLNMKNRKLSKVGLNFTPCLNTKLNGTEKKLSLSRKISLHASFVQRAITNIKTLKISPCVHGNAHRATHATTEILTQHLI